MQPLDSWASQTRGTKLELVTSPLLSPGPTGGQGCYATPAFLGVSGERICYATPAFRGVTNKGDKMRIRYLTFAFSGAHKWAELQRNTCILRGPQKRDEIRIGSLTLAFRSAHRWADLLRNPWILGRRKQGGRNENWLPHPCFLRGPQVGGFATQPLYSWGPPTKGKP